MPFNVKETEDFHVDKILVPIQRESDEILSALDSGNEADVEGWEMDGLVARQETPKAEDNMKRMLNAAKYSWRSMMPFGKDDIPDSKRRWAHYAGMTTGESEAESVLSGDSSELLEDETFEDVKEIMRVSNLQTSVEEQMEKISLTNGQHRAPATNESYQLLHGQLREQVRVLAALLGDDIPALYQSITILSGQVAENQNIISNCGTKIDDNEDVVDVLRSKVRILKQQITINENSNGQQKTEAASELQTTTLGYEKRLREQRNAWEIAYRTQGLRWTKERNDNKHLLDATKADLMAVESQFHQLENSLQEAKETTRIVQNLNMMGVENGRRAAAEQQTACKNDKTLSIGLTVGKLQNLQASFQTHKEDLEGAVDASEGQEHTSKRLEEETVVVRTTTPKFSFQYQNMGMEQNALFDHKSQKLTPDFVSIMNTDTKLLYEKKDWNTHAKSQLPVSEYTMPAASSSQNQNISSKAHSTTEAITMKSENIALQNLITDKEAEVLRLSQIAYVVKEEAGVFESSVEQTIAHYISKLQVPYDSFKQMLETSENKEIQETLSVITGLVQEVFTEHLELVGAWFQGFGGSVNEAETLAQPFIATLHSGHRARDDLRAEIGSKEQQLRQLIKECGVYQLMTQVTQMEQECVEIETRERRIQEILKTYKANSDQMAEIMLQIQQLRMKERKLLFN